MFPCLLYLNSLDFIARTMNLRQLLRVIRYEVGFDYDAFPLHLRVAPIYAKSFEIVIFNAPTRVYGT